MTDFTLTAEQQQFLDATTSWSHDGIDTVPTYPLILVDSVAGSSKTFSLSLAGKSLVQNNENHTTKYIVFGTANAKEASEAFGSSAEVSTIHALAYRAVVDEFGLNKNIAPFIHWRDIPKDVRIPFGRTNHIIKGISEFCTSNALSVNDWEPTEIELNGREKLIVKTLLNRMGRGTMRCTHDFYLKLFHIKLMTDSLQLPTIDTLMVDEINDLSRITLDIVTKYPAKQKILVGNKTQAIHHWMGCVSAFDYYQGQGLSLQLTQSFRVSNEYAPAIEAYLRKHCDPETSFTGFDYDEDAIISSQAFIARKNSTIIGEMIRCSEHNIKYKLVHSAKIQQMFKLPLFIVYAKPGKEERDSELKHLQTDVDNWGSLPISGRPSLASYLLQVNEDNPNIKAAIMLVLKHGKDTIIQIHAEAKEHKKSNCSYTLMSAHSSKGATFDEVTLADDMDESITDFVNIPVDKLSPEQQEAMNLYYVACTRHRLKLNNAKYLEFLGGV